jgi:thiaminase/transcriptional activator TenA
MGFVAETLADDAEPVWEAVLAHPMVEALGAGTLDREPFRYWLRQDYVYLVEYSRMFAYGAAKAPRLEQMRTFAKLLWETLDTEMDLHRSYAEDFGISEGQLESTEPSPTTRAYTDFLVRTSAHGSFGDIVAVLLPCMWGFNETGLRLQERGLPDDDLYARWIRTYAGDDFTDLTQWCKELMDEVAVDAPPDERARYRELFLTSARYEYRFWDAAWRQEEWDR